DTRVIRARIRGRLERATGTSRDVEILFAAPAGKDAWEVMVRPGKRVREGDRIILAGGKLDGGFGAELNHGLRLLYIASHIDEILESDGHVPLPPYIERPDSASDAVEYQTVYASVPGAVAAPTAGLHFTDEMFEKLRGRGIEIVKLTLHVGV